MKKASKKTKASAPSTHGPGGRGPDGKFAPGNKLGKGNPLAGRAARIRSVLLEKLTPEKAGAIVDAIIAKAGKGDLTAAKEIFDRTIGRPSQTDLAERIERLEEMLAEENES